jgi:hypothetical protein
MHPILPGSPGRAVGPSRPSRTAAHSPSPDQARTPRTARSNFGTFKPNGYDLKYLFQILRSSQEKFRAAECGIDGCCDPKERLGLPSVRPSRRGVADLGNAGRARASNCCGQHWASGPLEETERHGGDGAFWFGVKKHRLGPGPPAAIRSGLAILPGGRRASILSPTHRKGAIRVAAGGCPPS